jgi:murein DD-endopeptidase MepM/ murein hydrolase activator NlpD
VFKAHLGTDFAAPTGTPIMTTAKGIIIEAGYKINNGNYVKVKHNNIYSTQYLHMSKIGKNIKPGTIVKQGQIIGYVGSTGLATGPHVCYRFWKNGKQTNPFKEKQNIPNRLEDRYLNDYLQIFSEIKFKLDKISFENQINP